jgi:hypothetical protein
MKKLLILLLLVAAGYFGYTRYQEAKAGEYDIRAVEKRPIPQEHFYPLWTQAVLKMCDEPEKYNNLTRERCRELVTERSGTCAAKMAPKTPDVVETSAVAKGLGREFVQCAMPYPFCGGVEVRTEEEARRHCK